MRTQRGSVQVVSALVYLALLVAVLRVLMEFRGFTQRGSVWGVRGQLLLFGLFGVLVVGHALWGRRNLLGSVVVAGVLTVMMATSHAAFVQVQWLSSLWWELGLWSNATLPAVSWGGSLAALGAAFYAQMRPSTGDRAEESAAA